MKFWVALGGFRQPKNGLGRLPATEKRTTIKKTANSDVFKGFGMLEYWTHCKNQCFGPTLYWRTRKLCCFWRKDRNNTVRTCVLDRLYAQKCINYVGVEGFFLKHVQYLYKDWTKKLAVWAAPHAKRGELLIIWSIANTESPIISLCLWIDSTMFGPLWQLWGCQLRALLQHFTEIVAGALAQLHSRSLSI